MVKKSDNAHTGLGYHDSSAKRFCMAYPQAHRVLKDRRTKNLTKRLRPGDIALIHHSDLDTTAARALIDCRVSAVVNAVPSISGRYPNRGPRLLCEAGIPLLDSVGINAFESVHDGKLAVITGDSLEFSDGSSLSGELLTAERVEEMLVEARSNLSDELDLFVRNTLEYLSNEKELLFDPIEVPKIKTLCADKHVLIVVRGEGYKQDLAILGDYLRDVRPILLAVDGGADALLEVKLKPHIIVGDMDSVSDAALRCGAELVVHGYARGDARGAPGLDRVESMGLTATVFHSPGTSEDVAMLLANELGAKLIVAVGTHFSLEDFLDKGRNGMSSTFLTRLRIGSKLMDAKGIARLWSFQRPYFSEILIVILAAATPIIAVLWLSPMGHNILEILGMWLRIPSH